MSWHHHRLDPSVAIGLPVESCGAEQTHQLTCGSVIVVLWLKGGQWWCHASHAVHSGAVVQLAEGHHTYHEAFREAMEALCALLGELQEREHLIGVGGPLLWQMRRAATSSVEAWCDYGWQRAMETALRKEGQEGAA